MKKYWLNRNYKWLVPVVTVAIIGIYLLASSGLGRVSTDLAQAYADKNLYENAIARANDDDRVQLVLGEIQAIDKMTILNGEVRYENDNKNVTSTIKIIGSKGNGKLDLNASRIGESWEYEMLHVRVIEPAENAQTIRIITN